MRKRIRHAAWTAVQGFAYIFGFPVLAPVFRVLLVVAIHSLGFGNNRNHRFSGEAWFVQNVLKPAKIRTCIDVGANIGQYGSLLAESLDADIHSIEPLTSSFEVLKKNAPKRVHAYRYAVSDANGEIQIYSRGEEWEGATVHSDLVDAATVVETVPAITIDSFVERHSLRDVEFVKIDTEGHELEVLAGMQKLLASSPPQFIQFEFGGAHLKRGHTLFHFQKMLPGYTFSRLMSHGLLPIDPESAADNFFMFSNVIAQRSK